MSLGSTTARPVLSLDTVGALVEDFGGFCNFGFGLTALDLGFPGVLESFF